MSSVRSVAGADVAELSGDLDSEVIKEKNYHLIIVSTNKVLSTTQFKQMFYSRGDDFFQIANSYRCPDSQNSIHSSVWGIDCKDPHASSLERAYGLEHMGHDRLNGGGSIAANAKCYNFNKLGGRENDPKGVAWAYSYAHDQSRNFYAQHEVMGYLEKDTCVKRNNWTSCSRMSIEDQLYSLAFASETDQDLCLEITCARRWSEVEDALVESCEAADWPILPVQFSVKIDNIVFAFPVEGNVITVSSGSQIIFTFTQGPVGGNPAASWSAFFNQWWVQSENALSDGPWFTGTFGLFSFPLQFNIATGPTCLVFGSWGNFPWQSGPITISGSGIVTPGTSTSLLGGMNPALEELIAGGWPPWPLVGDLIPPWQKRGGLIDLYINIRITNGNPKALDTILRVRFTVAYVGHEPSSLNTWNTSSSVAASGVIQQGVPGDAPEGGAHQQRNSTIAGPAIPDTERPSVDSFEVKSESGETSFTHHDPTIVTLKFSERIMNFSSDDIDLPGRFFTLGAMTSIDGGITWTGTLTTAAEAAPGAYTLDVTSDYTDFAGNQGTTAVSDTFQIIRDIRAPSVESFTMSNYDFTDGVIDVPQFPNEPDNVYQIRQEFMQLSDTNATVLIKFSERVEGFDSDADIIAQNGTLSRMETWDNGKNWIGTFTSNDDIDDPYNILRLTDTYTDLVGNLGPTANTDNYVINRGDNQDDSDDPT